MTDTPLPTESATGVTIRRLNADDADDLTRLAQLDSARVPSGELLGADHNGRLVAAISTSTRDVIADPFQRTAEVVDVLRLRASQVDGHPPRGPRPASLLRPASAA